MSKALHSHSLRQNSRQTEPAAPPVEQSAAVAEDVAASQATTFPPVPQLQLLRFLQLSCAHDLTGYTPRELGLDLPDKLHHVSKGSSRKDCPFGFRVRTCNQCSPGVRIDLGTYAFLSDALLVNDAWQLMFGNTSKLQLLRSQDREWLHLLHVRRFLRRTSQVLSIKDILDALYQASEAETPSGPATRSSRNGAHTKRARSVDVVPVVKQKRPELQLSEPSAAALQAWQEQQTVFGQPAQLQQLQQQQQQAVMMAYFPMGECRFMMVNHAESLLAQFSNVENMVFAVMRVGYEYDDNARLDGYHMLSVLLRRHPQRLVGYSGQEVYRSPAAALHRLYASLCAKVLTSVASQAHHSVISSDIFEQLDLNIGHPAHVQHRSSTPPAKAAKTINTHQLYRDLLDTQGGDPLEFLTRTEVFVINVLADCWAMLCEEAMSFATNPGAPIPAEEEVRELLDDLFERKAQLEVWLRTCAGLVEGMFRPENTPEVNERIHRCLVKLRSAYVTAVLTLLSHEARVNPIWEEDATRHLEYANLLAVKITAVFGKRLHLLPARPASLVSDHRVGAVVAKAWNDLNRGLQPKMMAVDAAALDSISRRYAVYGTLGVHLSRFDRSDHPAESEIQALASIFQYFCLRQRVAEQQAREGRQPSRTSSRGSWSDRQSLATLAPVDLEALESCEDAALFEDALTELYPEVNKLFVLQILQQDLDWYLSFCRTEGVGALFPSGLRAVYTLCNLLTCNCDDVDASLRSRMIMMCKQLIDINRQTGHLADIVAKKMDAVQMARATLLNAPSLFSSQVTELQPLSPSHNLLEQALRDESFDDFFNLVEEAGQLSDEFFEGV